MNNDILVPAWLVVLGAGAILATVSLCLFAFRNMFKLQQFHFEMKFLISLFEDLAPAELRFKDWAEIDSRHIPGVCPDDLIKDGKFKQAAELLITEFGENRK